MNGTYFGTLTGFPDPPYLVDFVINGVTAVEETVSSTVVNLTTPDLYTTGTFNYGDNSYLLVFANMQAGTTVSVEYSVPSTEVVRPNPSNGVTVVYQTRPEDELEQATTDMSDEYPWRRDLVLGGELIDFNTYNPPSPDISIERVGQTAAVFSQTGAQYDAQVIVPGPYPPRFITNERSTDDYVPGQRAIALTGTFLDLAGTRPASGTLLGGLDSVMQPGWELYHFGLVQGVLVADPPKFYGDHHRTGLALWYPFNEQPLDALLVEDHSGYGANPFVTGLSPDDRTFDPVRGNYLAAKTGLALTSPVTRGFDNDVFSGGFWIRALNDYSSEEQILQAGPVSVSLSGSAGAPTAKFYLLDTSGTRNLIGTVSLLMQWNYLSWSFDGVSTLTVDQWDASGNLTNQAFSVAVAVDFSVNSLVSVTCPGAAFDLQDLRLWNVIKSTAQLDLARYHNPTPTACLYPPAFLQSVNTYDHYAVRVLPSGYLVPDQLPTSIITDKLAWVQRYDYLARYEAQSRFKETGVGSGNMLPVSQRLGSQWDTLTAAGTVTVSTWQGNFVGMNAAWIADNPQGQVLTLIESGSTVNGIPGTLLSTGTSIPWPNALSATNPCRDRIWVDGDDGFTWQVELSKNLGVVDFLTTKIFTQTGSEQPTGAEVLLSSDALNKRLAVNTSGTVYAGTYAGTLTTDPLYMYVNNEVVVSLSGTNAFNAWVDVNSFGLGQTPPVAAIQDNGQISFQINDALEPGFYALEVTSGNIGKVDSAFVGFKVVITVGDISFQGVLCSGQTGADFNQTDTIEFYLPHTLPGTPSSWLLTFDWSNSLSDSIHGTARQLEISSVKFTLHRSSLYKVEVAASSVPLTLMGVFGTHFPVTPGGWLATMTSWGTTYGYTHESQAYSANDTISNPQPFSNLLTATTALRREDIILAGSHCLSDPALPAFTTYGSIYSPCGP